MLSNCDNTLKNMEGFFNTKKGFFCLPHFDFKTLFQYLSVFFFPGPICNRIQLTLSPTLKTLGYYNKQTLCVSRHPKPS